MKGSIDVCLSPDLMHLYEVADKTIVVVDILRATSCMTTAFAHGVESITPFAQLADCLAYKDKGYITAGERDGKKVEGFDLGNSPFEYMNGVLKGQKLAFTTTNGTGAIVKSAGARGIIIGSFLNLSAVVDYLRKNNHNILVVCSGWKGKVNLEDTLFAGALVEHLKDDFKHACDAPLIAQRLYQSGRHNLMEFLKDSSHIQRLHRLNIHKDIDFCLTENHYHILPIVKDSILTVSKP